MLGLLLVLTAGAQELPESLDYSFDSERFKPMADHYGYAMTESSATLKHLQLGVGLWINYSEDPINFQMDGSRVQLFEGELDTGGRATDDGDGIIDKRAYTDLQVAGGFADRFSFAISVPILLWQEGFEPVAAHDPTLFDDDELLASGLGDIRVIPKATIVSLNDGPVGLAVLARATMPTGATRSFIGEGGPTFMPMAVFEVADAPVHKREYIFRAAVNVGYKIRPPANFGPDLPIGNEIIGRAAVALHLGEFAEIGADLSGSAGGLAVLEPIEVHPWLQLEALDLFVVNIGGGIGLRPGLGTPDYRIQGGMTLAPSFNPKDLDRDGDGIQNNKDQCPNVPEDIDGFEDADGCPDPDNDQDRIVDIKDSCPDNPEDYDGFQDTDGCPDLDNDGDGIVDRADRCPDVPETVNGFQDDDGCPDKVPERDSDGDGLFDNVDRCPFDPEDFDRFQDDDGCPDRDNDNDGIFDVVDECPLDAEDLDGFEDEDGCPEYDNDRDGIVDRDDECPDIPENFNNFEDGDGCPDSAPPRLVVIEKTHIVIHDKIYFETNKAIIQPISFALVDEIANVMLDNPNILKIQVEGHTDSVGDDAYNLDLSQRRAQAVVTYLINKQVEADRLTAMGFGELAPITENDTDEGKAANRRVEFRILARE